MIDVSDIMMQLDWPSKWPEARKWLIDTYGSNAYLPLPVTEGIYHGQLPEVPEFEERWAILPLTVERPESHETFFYIHFNDPKDETAFILKWL